MVISCAVFKIPQEFHLSDCLIFGVHFCASRNKPYCDNSHKEISFQDSGSPETDDLLLDLKSAPLNIDPMQDGPLIVEGPVEIRNTDDVVVNRVDNTALCRCGTSENKPYCDGSHAQIGFKG